MIKIVDWLEKLEELKLDVSKSEGYSPVSFCLLFREAKTRPSFTTESAFLIEEKEDPVAMYLSDVFKVMAILAGITAVSIPVGLSEQKLPLGIQIIANFF
jgi:hypothetical protein